MRVARCGPRDAEALVSKITETVREPFEIASFDIHTSLTIGVSMYPLDAQYIPPIKDFIERLNRHGGLRVITNQLGTQVFGDHDRIFEILRQEMHASFTAGGKAIFVTRFIGPWQQADA